MKTNTVEVQGFASPLSLEGIKSYLANRYLREKLEEAVEKAGWDFQSQLEALEIQLERRDIMKWSSINPFMMALEEVAVAERQLALAKAKANLEQAREILACHFERQDALEAGLATLLEAG